MATLEREHEILVSTVVIAELDNNLEEFQSVRELMGELRVKILNMLPEDHDLAWKIQEQTKYQIEFNDCLHIAVSKRMEAILATRDETLLKYAVRYIEAGKPEYLPV